MSTIGSKPNRVPGREPEHAAADWIVRRNAGLTAGEQAELQSWLRDPAHAAALVEAEAGWQRLNSMRDSGHADELRTELRRRRTRRTRRRWTLAGVGMAAGVALLLVRQPIDTPVAPVPASVAVKPDRLHLEDGSMVVLNAGARLAVEFTPELRTVRLLQGEAMFHVAKNSGRPFVVSAAHVRVTVVGTAFAVRHAPDSVGVLVAEGQVSVDRASAAAEEPIKRSETLSLTAGSRVVVPALARSPIRPESVNPTEIKHALAWREKRLEFSGTTVVQAVELFNRANALQLHVVDPRVGELRLSGLFWSDDPEAFARLLESGMNVRVERVGNSIRLSRR